MAGRVGDQAPKGEDEAVARARAAVEDARVSHHRVVVHAATAAVVAETLVDRAGKAAEAARLAWRHAVEETASVATPGGQADRRETAGPRADRPETASVAAPGCQADRPGADSRWQSARQLARSAVLADRLADDLGRTATEAAEAVPAAAAAIGWSAARVRRAERALALVTAVAAAARVERLRAATAQSAASTAGRRPAR